MITTSMSFSIWVKAFAIFRNIFGVKPMVSRGEGFVESFCASVVNQLGDPQRKAASHIWVYSTSHRCKVNIAQTVIFVRAINYDVEDMPRLLNLDVPVIDWQLGAWRGGQKTAWNKRPNHRRCGIN